MEGVDPPLLQDVSDDGSVPDDSFHYCPPGLTQDASGCRLVWRLITVCICLPLCYPCYLTKHARQYHRKRTCTPRKVMPGTCPTPHDGTLTSTASDASPSRSTTLGSSRGDRDHQAVSVIFLKSETGFQMLNSLKMESVCKSQGVKGKSVITVGNFTCDLAISQETCLSKLTPEEIHNNASLLVSDIDCIVIVFSSTEELEEVVTKPSGIVGYTKKYWNGYFPVMLIQVAKQSEQFTIKKSLIEKIEEGFSSSFRLIIGDLKSSQAILFDALARFYQHEVRLQCSKLDKTYNIPDLNYNTSSNSSLHSPSWRCSGLCGLTNQAQGQAKRRTNFLSAARKKLFSHSIST